MKTQFSHQVWVRPSSETARAGRDAGFSYPAVSAESRVCRCCHVILTRKDQVRPSHLIARCRYRTHATFSSASDMIPGCTYDSLRTCMWRRVCAVRWAAMWWTVLHSVQLHISLAGGCTAVYACNNARSRFFRSPCLLLRSDTGTPLCGDLNRDADFKLTGKGHVRRSR